MVQVEGGRGHELGPRLIPWPSGPRGRGEAIGRSGPRRIWVLGGQ